MAGLTLRDVRKRYGDVQVMHGVDLDIEEVNSSYLSAHQAVVNQPCCA